LTINKIWVGTEYEILDKTQLNIRFLIDKEGNTFTPSLDNPYYWNLIDNFGTNEKAQINYNNVAINDLNNINIFRSGKSAAILLLTEAGNGSVEADTQIQFGDPTKLILNYNSSIFSNPGGVPEFDQTFPSWSVTTSTLFPLPGQPIHFLASDSPYISGSFPSTYIADGANISFTNNTMANGGGYFTVTQSSRNVRIRVELDIEFQLWGAYGGGDIRYGIYSQIGSEPPTIVAISSFHNFSNNGLGWGPIVNFGSKTTSFLIPHSSPDFPTNQRFYPFFIFNGSLFSSMITKFNFRISQNLSPSYTIYSNLNYWVTGSSSNKMELY